MGYVLTMKEESGVHGMPSNNSGKLNHILVLYSWGGSRIVRFTKDGEIDFQIIFPSALNVTACCFGGVSAYCCSLDPFQLFDTLKGPNNDQMFVTTAHCGAIGGDASRQVQYPDSGHLFWVNLVGRFRGLERSQFAG